MERHKNSAVWIEEGYRLFSQEGLDGIQVERLARILGLNKSGFYHYFGDFESFCTELTSLHKEKVGRFLDDVAKTKNIDPEYLHLLIKHGTTVMAQVQFTRDPSHHQFYAVSEWVDHSVNISVRKIWSEFLHLPTNSDLSVQYYSIIRDAFYTRISFQNLNYNFLHNLASEARMLIDEIVDQKAPGHNRAFD